MALTKEELASVQIQLDVCIQEEHKLTDWERGFIESISDQVTNYYHLSSTQLEWLKKIYDRVV